MRQPGIHHLMSVYCHCRDGGYPAKRIERFSTNKRWWRRWRAAWLVFTGQGDVLVWPNTPLERKIWGEK